MSERKLRQKLMELRMAYLNEDSDSAKQWVSRSVLRHLSQLREQLIDEHREKTAVDTPEIDY